MDTNQGMTIKEIAEIANVSESTIRNWITLAGIARPSAETAGLSAKTADAQETKQPALFDLAEVIAIIRAGGKNTLANLVADNAARKAQKKTSGLEMSMDTNQTNGVPVTVEYRNGQERVNAQELHTALGVGTRFNDWINRRIEEYGFIHGEDYEIFDYSKLSNQDSAHGGDRRSKDYSLSLGMAKELAMLEKNERGREIRKYFIAVEKRAREVSLLFQKLGGAEQAMTYALMGRIYQVFAGNRKIGINTMFKIMEYALARSPVTGEYFLAADIARLISNEQEAGYSTGKSSIDRYVAEIRKIVAEFGFVPTMIREPNGGYHAMPPVNTAVPPTDRPGFPLNLPEDKKLGRF